MQSVHIILYSPAVCALLRWSDQYYIRAGWMDGCMASCFACNQLDELRKTDILNIVPMLFWVIYHTH